jgi:hypothetical protein
MLGGLAGDDGSHQTPASAVEPLRQILIEWQHHENMKHSMVSAELETSQRKLQEAEERALKAEERSSEFESRNKELSASIRSLRTEYDELMDQPNAASGDNEPLISKQLFSEEVRLAPGLQFRKGSRIPLSRRGSTGGLPAQSFSPANPVAGSPWPKPQSESPSRLMKLEQMTQQAKDNLRDLSYKMDLCKRRPECEGWLDSDYDLLQQTQTSLADIKSMTALSDDTDGGYGGDNLQKAEEKIQLILAVYPLTPWQVARQTRKKELAKQVAARWAAAARGKREQFVLRAERNEKLRFFQIIRGYAHTKKAKKQKIIREATRTKKVNEKAQNIAKKKTHQWRRDVFTCVVASLLCLLMASSVFLYDDLLASLQSYTTIQLYKEAHQQSCTALLATLSTLLGFRYAPFFGMQ